VTVPVAVVTGATGGIGRWIALGLAKAGRHVVLVGRDAGRAQSAQAWIASRMPDASTEIRIADLSSLGGTRMLANAISESHPAISLLVNNAGIFSERRVQTPEGHERVLATNHLSPFVLSLALEPALRAAGQARIVTVGSDTSDKARMDPANLELTRGWNLVRAYSRAKLAQMMTTFTLAERLAGSGVTANVVHPGAVATGLVRSPGIIGLSWRLMAPFLLTEEQGADTPLHVALSPDLADATGLYFKKRMPVTPNRRALDPALRTAVWTATEQLVRPG
jgi:NAD(P)-dependent dehydrogenase (short-subunit alcohol dehydrogenase family)